ncbi:ABC transporter substrate-binding protein [Nguyenibacter sp. L1]|uniref:ABC transporter substrate-binding protein n=1 Tax=Nguyenibacter sp. L1 TaxID=3049350 RepID=UPI002B46683E|nr:ABC transporter substrate-binding protein [Nguyenibacter sp. L1]WRH86867.1 ABC transporter substrate-binding protein [Nguyenibacter sp. L1]
MAARPSPWPRAGRGALLLAAALLGGVPRVTRAAPPASAGAAVLRIAANPIYPPLEFRDPLTDRLTGFDIALGEALAQRMTMRAVWQETSFPQMIPSLQSQRTDMILSGFSDLPSRRGALDFVRYLKSGAQVLVLRDDPIHRPEDLCGKYVAASRATAFPAMIRDWSRVHCAQAGHPDMVVYPSESGADARTQLLQGRVSAMVQGSETVGYFIDITHGAFRRLGTPLSMSYLAMAFAKSRPDLREGARVALGAMIADGTYARLLRRWSLQEDAIEMPSGDTAP